MVFGCMRPLSHVIQLQHGCPSQRKGANTAIEARLQVLSDVGLPPTTATKKSRRAGYYTNETRLHRVLKPCGLQQQQTASTGLSVFELRRGDALAPLYSCTPWQSASEISRSCRKCFREGGGPGADFGLSEFGGLVRWEENGDVWVW